MERQVEIPVGGLVGAGEGGREGGERTSYEGESDDCGEMEGLVGGLERCHCSEKGGLLGGRIFGRPGMGLFVWVLE